MGLKEFFALLQSFSGGQVPGDNTGADLLNLFISGLTGGAAGGVDFGGGEQSDDASLQALRDALDPAPAGQVDDQLLLQALQATQGNVDEAAQFINSEFRQAGLQGLSEALAAVLGQTAAVETDANPFAFIQQQIDLGVIGLFTSAKVNTASGTTC